MTVEPQAWLPAPALFDGVLADRVGGVVEAWRRRWLAAPEKSSLRFQAGGTLSASQTGWRSSCGRLLVLCDRQAELRLAAAMLGMRPRANRASADLALLNRLAEEAIAGLFTMLADVLRSGATAERMTKEIKDGARDISVALQFNVSGPGGRLFDVHVTPEAAVAGRKAAIVSGRSAPQLGRRQDAIARQDVRVGAIAGSGQIELSELRSLAVGDVLVLDRKVGDRFDLTMNGRRIASGDLRLRHDGKHLLLQSANSERGGVT